MSPFSNVPRMDAISLSNTHIPPAFSVLPSPFFNVTVVLYIEFPLLISWFYRFCNFFFYHIRFLLDNQWVFIYYFNVDAINVHIVAWLSLVERCVRDAEVASSNLVATTKKTPSHMCEGVFLSPHCSNL